MAKLVALAFSFAALVAFASAHATIVTTTIYDENPISPQQCSQELQGQQLYQCQNYLQQKEGLDQCCNELQIVDQQCQCAVVQHLYQQVQQQQQQQQQQGETYGSKQTEKLRKRAKKIYSKCNLKKQCQSGSIITTTTTTITEDNPSSGSQDCSRTIQGQRFHKCQRYIKQAQQSGSPRTPLMSYNSQGQQQTQELRQCCNELENVEIECQCEAMQEVYRQAKEDLQEWSQQGGQRGGQQKQMQGVRSIVENLRNDCKLQAPQCHISSAMF